MAKTKKEKQSIIEAYVKNLNESRALFVITPTEITPNEINNLRKKLKDVDSSITFIKNTLLEKALEKSGKKLDDISFDNQKAVLFSKENASESAKILSDFLEEIKKGEIEGGLLDETSLSLEDIEELANLPPKEQMIAISISAIASPLSSFVNVLNANITNFMNVLNNISEDKE